MIECRCYGCNVPEWSTPGGRYDYFNGLYKQILEEQGEDRRDKLLDEFEEEFKKCRNPTCDSGGGVSGLLWLLSRRFPKKVRVRDFVEVT